MIPLTVPETLRQLRLTDAPLERRVVGLRWSLWRRRHQAIARAGHIARRARMHPPIATQPATIIRLPGVPTLDATLTEHLLAVLPSPIPRGRPRVTPTKILSGIVWLMRSGRTWRDIPAEYGPWATSASRYRLWQQDGTWPRIAAVLTATSSETTNHQ